MPPEIIVFDRVIDFPLPLRKNERGDGSLFTAFVNEPVNRHHPSEEEAVFPECLNGERGASGHAGTSTSVHGRNVLLISMKSPEERVETRRRGLFAGGVPGHAPDEAASEQDRAEGKGPGEGLHDKNPRSEKNENNREKHNILAL
jgi:hypothetical protein